MKYIYIKQTFSCEIQEPEIEYIEGYDEIEEEDDIEDFGGLSMYEPHTGDDNGKANSRYTLDFSFVGYS